MKPPYKGALFEQNAHLQFKYKLTLSLINLENQVIHVKAQMIVAHLCTKEVKGKKRGSFVFKFQLLASLYHPVFTNWSTNYNKEIWRKNKNSGVPDLSKSTK